MGWEDIEFEVEQIAHPEISEFLTAFAQVYNNGEVIFRSLRATDGGAFDRVSRHQFRGMDHAFQSFLTSPSVVAALPELQIQIPLEQPPEFQWTSLFGLEGELTDLLLKGGAYNRFSGTVEQARAQSRRFMTTVFGEQLHIGGWAGYSSTPWTQWFFDVAWDSTFIVQDSQSKRFVLLCLTDTD